MGHSMSDQPMVCESPLRFRLNLAHVQIMPKNKYVQIFRDVQCRSSGFRDMTFQKMEKGSFFCDNTRQLNVNNFFSIRPRGRKLDDSSV